nr:T9SS type A sorting domain-containing protein [Bacteroidales bacterium]
QSQPYIFVNFVNNNAYAESWEWDFGDGFNGSGSKNIEHGYYQPGEYTVQVEVTQDGCTKTAEKLIVIEDHTGGITSKTGNGEITLYPNPGSGQVVIKTNNGSTIGSIRISSTSGKQMYKADISGQEIIIDINQWNAGTYLVECKEHGVMKLVVE